MQIGTKVKVIKLHEKCKANIGATAVVVGYNNYTSQYEWLLRWCRQNNKDENFILNNYVAVKWLNEPTFTAHNGIYAKRLFQEID